MIIFKPNEKTVYVILVLRQKTKQNEKEKNVSVFSGWDSRFSEL